MLARGLVVVIRDVCHSCPKTQGPVLLCVVILKQGAGMCVCVCVCVCGDPETGCLCVCVYVCVCVCGDPETGCLCVCVCVW